MLAWWLWTVFTRLWRCNPQQRSALHWFYNASFKEADNKAQTPYDTGSPYPHRAILALLNWPLDTTPARTIDRLATLFQATGKDNYFFCRNRWHDGATLSSLSLPATNFVRCV